MEEFFVEKSNTTGDVVVQVPGSKSVTNRALLLAALSEGECVLNGALFSDDSRALLDCLQELGFSLRVDEGAKKVVVSGMGGAIPKKSASLNVRSAGTAARFVTVMLAFAGEEGSEYVLYSSSQMEKRPMEPLLAALRGAGTEITCLKEEGRFPFVLRPHGVTANHMTVDTTVSSQFASAVLMGAPLCKGGMTVRLTGERTQGAYIGITLRMMQAFGVHAEKTGDSYYIPSGHRYRRASYAIEPDFSAAGYFFAAGALLNRRVTVEGLHSDSMQGDKKFLDVLSDMGASVEDGPAGISVCGNGKLRGVRVNMKDFSDQALTLAAIAPFAEGETVISGVGHIRKQECDRIRAMALNLRAMGVRVEERDDGVTVFPAEKILPCKIETFGDHRVAMAFAVAGLKSGGLTIENPSCCKKTFENYFDVLTEKFYAEGEN